MDNPLFFEALSRFYTRTDNDFNIYAIYSFIDDKTNTSSTHISVYSKDDIEFKENHSNVGIKSEFLGFIKHPVFNLNLKKFIPINSEYLSLSSDKKSKLIRNKKLVMKLKFKSMEQVLQNQQSFTMACLGYTKYKDWRYFYKNRWSFCFDIDSSVESSQLLKLELKSKHSGNSPFFVQTIPLKKGPQTYWINFNEETGLEEDFKELAEFDLTIPFDNLNENTKDAKISISKIAITAPKRRRKGIENKCY